MKKIGLLLVLLLLAQCLFLVACNNNNSNNPDETPTQPPEVYDEIATQDLSKYALICPARTSGGVSVQFWQMSTYINTTFGLNMVAENDRYYEESEFEILIGDTNRKETEIFLSNLLWDDYGYAIVDKKLVIAGHTDEGTVQAVMHFLEHMKNTDHTSLFFTNKNQYLFRYPYVSDTFLLNGVDVSRAKIVVNAKGSDEQIAQVLSDKSLELCGRRPTIVTDAEVVAGDALLIIGASAHVPAAMQAEWDASYATIEGKSAYYVGSTDNVLWINTPVFEGYSAINRDILPQIQANTTATLSLATGVVKVPQVFSVMSFNVYVGSFNTSRTQRVIDTIVENTPSVFGVQEASVVWMAALKNGLGDLYTAVGAGRDGIGLGEHSAIFYRTDKFNLIDSGTKWLSNTPDVAGSKLARANFPRIMTYVVLERKIDGVRFLYVNTHLDHNGNNSTEVAEQVRQEQIEILIAEINKLGDYPTIVTGDFNVSPGASAYTTMLAGGFSDASLVAKKGEVKPTYNGMEDDYEGAIIDYIFVSPGLADAVDTYTVCPAKRDGEWISDHNAIIATITLPTTEPQE